MIPPSSAGLFALAIVAAAAYAGALLGRPPSILGALVKGAAVGALAAAAWSLPHAGLLAAELTLSASADVLAAAPWRRRAAPAAQALWLLALAADLQLFARAGGGLLMFRAEPVRLALGALAISSSVLAVRLVWPRLGPLRGPALVWASGLVGLCLAGLTLPWGRWPAMAGAAGLLLSAALAASARFGPEGARPPGLERLAFGLYAAGQAGLAAAFVFTPDP